MTTALLAREHWEDTLLEHEDPLLELDIDVFKLTAEVSPVRVNNNELVVESGKLETNHIYPFTYLDTKMFLWKAEDNSVNIYQLIEE